MEYLNLFSVVKQQRAERHLGLMGIPEGMRTPLECISKMHLTVFRVKLCHNSPIVTDPLLRKKAGQHGILETVWRCIRF